MSAKWERVARGEVLRGQFDPDYTPRHRIPARRWWQFWKPKWQWVEGVSQNTLRRAYGYPASAESRPMRSLGEEINELFGFRF